MDPIREAQFISAGLYLPVARQAGLDPQPHLLVFGILVDFALDRRPWSLNKASPFLSIVLIDFNRIPLKISLLNHNLNANVPLCRKHILRKINGHTPALTTNFS